MESKILISYSNVPFKQGFRT